MPDDQGIGVKNMLSKVEQTFLDVGTTVGKYTIIEEIDHGGMAVVYKALQLDLDREVALKVMPAHINVTPHLLERFLSEAHAVARLNHPNIINIHEVAYESGVYFIAMDYVPGKNLFFYLNEFKPKLVEVVDIVSILTDALSYAHNLKIVHRDLKLNNVIMRDNHIPILIDFGLAKAIEDDTTNITRTGEIVGSPAYMAPERIVGSPSDHRADICSLGIMLYEMLTFKNPYLDQRSIHQTTMNVIEANPISPRKLVPWLPPEIEAITLKAMAADPAKRYQTMEEFGDDLRRYQKGEQVLAQPPSFSSRVRHITRKYWPHITISALVLAFSTIFAISFIIQSQKGKSHWQLIYQERFNKRLPREKWMDGSTAGTGDSLDWNVDQGVLRPTRESLRWYTLQQSFTRDIRVEFDITSDSIDFFHAGAYLYGESPDSGYAFHIHRNGLNEHGITLPGNKVLFADYDPLLFPTSRTYHVEIERDDGIINFRLNGQTVAHRHDLIPPLGKHHRTVGLFSSRSHCSFDNLRVFQRAIPLSPSPTLIADRLWERGEFQSALEEYGTLQIDLTRHDFARHLLTRIPDCLIRLGRDGEAYEQLVNGPGNTLRSESLRQQTRFFIALAAEHLHRYREADSLYMLLLASGIDNSSGQSAEAMLASRINAQISAGDIDRAEAKLSSLATRCSMPSRTFGILHLKVVDRYLKAGKIDKALRTAETILNLYEGDEFVHSKAQVASARALLNKREKDEAIDILNQCIATHIFTEGVWEAWMLLAAIYENDHNFNDAMTIYRKIYRECPHCTVYPWNARIKMGELADRVSIDENRQTIFDDVIEADHPFPEPRLVARFFAGELAENQFTVRWAQLHPDDKEYLLHIARRALINNEPVVARVYLQEYRLFLPYSSWQYARVQRVINEISKY